MNSRLPTALRFLGLLASFMCVRACVCARERERERHTFWTFLFVVDRFHQSAGWLSQHGRSPLLSVQLPIIKTFDLWQFALYGQQYCKDSVIKTATQTNESEQRMLYTVIGQQDW